MDDRQTAPRSGRSSISIAFLFYIITLCAILVAALQRISVNEAVTGWVVAAVLAVGIGVGLLIGLLFGVVRVKGPSGALVGCCAGAVVGAIAGPISLIGSDQFYSVLALTLFGCWILIALMLLATRLGDS
ncbi:hypothetical protein Q31a_65100 [Aureliella helgolandensis]|uniref:Uncharacterized protein n=2 Tax=Aureliella helgolandensis TaxID=2527968 RepID=A0A518GHN5_9BACT|nr:hypothetical protein Q31a_65100 [Aureliella helgolandensis]